LRIILAGFGTVGQALTKVLHQDEKRIVQAYGFRPLLTTIVDSTGSCSNEAGLDIPLVLRTKEKYGTVAKYPGTGRRNDDIRSIISDSDAEVVVETTPTNFKDGEPGLSTSKQPSQPENTLSQPTKGLWR
jgi:homoserine dehydrogenase